MATRLTRFQRRMDLHNIMRRQLRILQRTIRNFLLRRLHRQVQTRVSQRRRIFQRRINRQQRTFIRHTRNLISRFIIRKGRRHQTIANRASFRRDLTNSHIQILNILNFVQTRVKTSLARPLTHFALLFLSRQRHIFLSITFMNASRQTRRLTRITVRVNAIAVI